RTNPYRRIFITGLLAGGWDSTSEARPQPEPDQPRIGIEIWIVRRQLVTAGALRPGIRQESLSIIGIQPVRRNRGSGRRVDGDRVAVVEDVETPHERFHRHAR